MNPLRSVGARLGLGLAVVVAFALLLVDLIVVPSLENNLIKSKLGQLREEVPTVAQQVVASSTFTLVDTLQAAASSSNARVVWFNVLTAAPLTLTVYADSNSISTADVQNDRIALAAYRDGAPASGTVSWHGQRYAESAVPVAEGVVLLRASLHDSLRSIALVRRRLVIAGLIALSPLRCSSVTSRQHCSRAGFGGSSARRTGSPAATSASR